MTTSILLRPATSQEYGCLVPRLEVCYIFTSNPLVCKMLIQVGHQCDRTGATRSE